MKVFKVIFTLIIFTVFAACSDKDAEKKISDLESQLAELENSGSNSNPGTVTPNTNTSTSNANEEPEGPLPAFNWNEEEYDFGTIKEGDVVEHTFTFENSGEAPLIIESARASCGCTVPKWPRDPIPPGETGEVLVRFDSKNKTNVQNKTVTITANTYPKISRLRIKTFVTPKNQAQSETDGPVKD